MTHEVLHEALGKPALSENRVYKGKMRETLKYGKKLGHRYARIIYLEDGRVVGWRN
jgi:hypothetical protein